jgi:hypothetical protein
MTSRTDIQNKSTMSPVPISLSISGILQRKCEACGQHTIAGEMCSECEKEESLIQRSTKGVGSLPAAPLPPPNSANSGFNHDISRVSVRRRRPLIQAKLTVGEPGDQYEQEADRIADQVMRMPTLTTRGELRPTTPFVSQRLTKNNNDQLESQHSEKCIKNEYRINNGTIQGKVQNTQSLQVMPGFEAQIASKNERGKLLTKKTRALMETRFGRSFQQVRVHTDDTAAQLNQMIGARAFTHGQQVYFGAGYYRPEAPAGQWLLAHELVHVIQQGGAEQDYIQRDFLTSTTEAGPETAEASLPNRPNRPPHEIVLMSGGPTSNRQDREHDRNPLNFATAARIRIERLMESAFGDQRQMIPQDQITWVVMRPPYRYRALEDNKAADAYTDQLQTQSLPGLQSAWDRLANGWREQHPEEAAHIPIGVAAIKLYFVDNTNNFVNFMNEGAGGGGREAASFSSFTAVSMPIGRFEYFGHGVPGQLWFTMGWEHLGSIAQSFSTDDISSLDPSVFISEGEYRSWSCNTATPPGNNQDSFVQAWVERLGGRFVGAVGRTTYEYLKDRNQVLLSTEPYRSPLGTRPAYWMTTQATGGSISTQIPSAVSLPSSQTSPVTETTHPTAPPGWVHETELPLSSEAITEPTTEERGTALPTVSEDVLRSIGERSARASTETMASREPSDLVCSVDIVPLDEPALPGDLVCSPEGAGRLNSQSCIPEDNSTTAPPPSPIQGQTTGTPGAGFYPVQEIYINEPNNHMAPDANNPAWQPFLNAVADRAYHETLDTDSTPGTGANMIYVAREVRARSRGFYIGVVERQGRLYYKIFGSQGARAGIPGRWYASHNLPGSSATLGGMVNPRIGLGAGLRSGSVGLGGVLTVGGTTLDYAIDPQKEFGTDYAVDIAFDLVKSAGSSAAGGAAGAAVTGWLAAGALGASIGSAAPVVGTVIGFVVGVLAAMAIEYFIEDYRASLKAWLRGRHDIRGDNERPDHRLGGEK